MKQAIPDPALLFGWVRCLGNGAPLITVGAERKGELLLLPIAAHAHIYFLTGRLPPQPRSKSSREWLAVQFHQDIALPHPRDLCGAARFDSRDHRPIQRQAPPEATVGRALPFDL